MSLAARFGQIAVVLIIVGLLAWQAARHARRHTLLLERFRRHQEP